MPSNYTRTEHAGVLRPQDAADLSVVSSVSDLRVVHTPDAEAHPDRLLRVDREAHAQGGAAPEGSTSARYRRLVQALVASDVVCLVAAMVASYAILFGVGEMSAGYLAVVGIAPVLWLPVFHAFGLYAPHHLSAPEEFRRTISAASVGVILVALATYWSRTSSSRVWIGLTWLIVLVLALTARRVSRWIAWRLKSEGRLAFRTLVIGANEEAATLAKALSAPGLGFAPLGYVSVSEGETNPNGLPLMGHIEELEDLITSTRADCLFVASTSVGSGDMLRVVQAARQAGIEVRVSANLPQILTSRLSVQPVGHVMSLSVKPVRLSGSQTVVKRVFDVLIAAAVLLVCLPVLAGIALAIRLTSKGPILFRQERITKGGRSFNMLKFRTMVEDADRVLLERSIDPSAPFFKMQDDPRLTRVGSLLRKLSLDELPQLFNVIRGDMSLVGPRPLPAEQVAANLELLGPRHEVSAGVTGWWQVNGRSDLDPEEALRMDLFYIENWSLALDLYILLKTFGAIMARRGAY